jgi:hypothetical protein
MRQISAEGIRKKAVKARDGGQVADAVKGKALAVLRRRVRDKSIKKIFKNRVLITNDNGMTIWSIWIRMSWFTGRKLGTNRGLGGIWEGKPAHYNFTHHSDFYQRRKPQLEWVG